MNTFVFIVRRFYDSIFNSNDLLFRVNLLDYNPHDKPSNSEVEVMDKKSFQEITCSEKRTLREYGGVKFLSLFEKRLKKGQRLFLAFISGEVAGALWVYAGGGRRFYSIPLSEKEFMCFDNFTIDKFRRKGVSTTLFIHTLTTMKKEGLQHGFVFAKEWNWNQKAILKAGFQEVGRFREFKILKRHIMIWTSVNHDL